jgi:hypothetical protein
MTVASQDHLLLQYSNLWLATRSVPPSLFIAMPIMTAWKLMVKNVFENTKTIISLIFATSVVLL